jgi:hypothetical protein
MPTEPSVPGPGRRTHGVMPGSSLDTAERGEGAPVKVSRGGVVRGSWEGPRSFVEAGLWTPTLALSWPKLAREVKAMDDLPSRSTTALLLLYRGVHKELRRRGVYPVRERARG